jgi:hypothetical protein
LENRLPGLLCVVLVFHFLFFDYVSSFGGVKSIVSYYLYNNMVSNPQNSFCASRYFEVYLQKTEFETPKRYFIDAGDLLR